MLTDRRPAAASRGALVAFALAGLALAGSAAAIPLTCTSTPTGAPPFTVDLVAPLVNGTIVGCRASVVGQVRLDTPRDKDVYLIVDSSGSTAGASGVDVDLDGRVGVGDWRSNDDLGDSTLAAELEAVRRALAAWEGRGVRVALIEYSAVIPIPPGEPSEQGRIRTVTSLTADFDRVRTGMGTILASGSVGATDYGGALLELAAEFDRSSDPTRQPVAFFLSDGKPTFPRYPYDSTETLDVEHALNGAAQVAARGLPTSTLEIGTFDDIGVLRDVANLTGGTLLPGLVGGELLDALATMDLDGFAFVRARNETSGEERYTTLDAFGAFSTDLALVNGTNSLTFTAVLRTPAGEWAITCPVTLQAACPQLEAPPDGGTGGGGGGTGGGGGVTPPPGRGGGDGGGGGGGAEGGGSDGGGGATNVRRPDGGLGRRYPPPPRQLHPWTADRLRPWVNDPCLALEGTAPQLNTDCRLALQQLAALLISIETGELKGSCALDPDLAGGYLTVDSLIAALEDALNRNSRSRCTNTAAAAAAVTAGQAFAPQPVGPAPSGNPSFDCTLVREGADVNVTVNLTSPAPGATGTAGDCPATLSVRGGSSAAGTADHDVYFVVDVSGSTNGDSGRDVDGDGTNESTLEAELFAIETFLDRLDPARVRVALVEFSAVIPIPPGLPSEQGRIRTVRSLTPDFNSIRAGLAEVLAAGPNGATDYGGALLELAAEYDRSGNPARGQVAFFLSDGKPTFPRYPYDSTEPLDIDHALNGAAACAARSLTVNTYEVGVFDDLSVLLSVAQVTGGRFYASLAGGAIVDALPGSSLVGIESVVVTNELTGVSGPASVAPDGSWVVDVALAPGENRITIRVTSDNGVEIVECSTTFVGNCAWPSCAARPPAAWHDEDCP